MRILLDTSQLARSNCEARMYFRDVVRGLFAARRKHTCVILDWPAASLGDCASFLSPLPRDASSWSCLESRAVERSGMLQGSAGHAVVYSPLGTPRALRGRRRGTFLPAVATCLRPEGAEAMGPEFPEAGMPIPWAVTLTRATKTYLVDGLGLPASRVRWIPPGAGQMPTWEPSGRGIRLPDEPYVLTVAGNAFRAAGGASRREFGTVLEGFESCLRRSRRALRLLVLGEPTILQRQQVWWRGLGRHVEFLGSPPPLERARILASARVYLPTGEGDEAWLQVREALGLGTPMVVPRGVCLDEILGDACLTYPRRSPEDLAAALARCMESDDLTRWLSRRAMERARAFSWTDFTLKLLDLLSEAAREPAMEVAIPACYTVQ